LESAHNADGLREAMRQLAMTPHGGLHMVIGAVNDKDISSMLALMPKHATYYFCRPDIPRGLDAALLAQKGRSAGLSGTHHLSVAAAFGTALHSAQPDDLIYVGGSMFVVAEVLREHR
jgi:dihydrofolate synthase/folylpolyglutamate synthase